jgi:hypothetical protein
VAVLAAACSGGGVAEEAMLDRPADAPAARDGAPAPSAEARPPLTTVTTPPPDAPAAAAADAGAPVETAPTLTAGSVDDNAAWEDYLRYRAEALAAGIDVEPFEVAGRTVLTVADGTGRPVHGAALRIGDGDGATELRTGTDGRAVWFGPTDVGDAQQRTSQPVVVAKGEARARVDVTPGTAATITLDGAPRAGEVPVEVSFLLDATGSMADEIEQLKANLTSVADRLGGLDGVASVRFAMTAYRDRGDEFVTRSTDLTGDLGRFREELAALVADGGGDYPEAVSEGLAEAVGTTSWSDDPDAVKLVFLVGDAPPQRHPDGARYTDAQRRAAAAGITILPIAANELDATGEFVFRQLALATLGRFVFLTYGAGGAGTGTETAMHVDDYGVLSLDDLVVRLVDEELAPLRG